MDMKNMVKILVVEDDSSSATFLTIALKAIGYQVVGVATSGSKAIELAQRLKPTLVLTDIELEGAMDGIEVARYCQEQLHLPVVYLTSHADGETLARAKLTGSLGYLLKPFIKKELAIALEMALYKHRLEQQLKTQERWLATILNSMGEGVIAVDALGQITFMNPMAETLTGWSVVEAMNQKLELVFKTINDPQDLLTLFHLFTQEAILQAHHGQEIPIAINLTPLQNEHNETIGRLLNFRDISQFKESQARVELLSSALEQSREALLITSAELEPPGPEIIFVNAAFTKMTGYSFEEIRGQIPRILQGPKTNQELLKKLSYQLRNGESFNGETVNYRKDGSEYNLEWSITPVRNEHGKIDHFISFQRNITKRKQAEQILKDSLAQIEQAKQEWEATADVLPELVCLVDAEQRVIRANRIVEHWGLGQVTQIKGLQVHDLLHPSCTQANCLLQQGLSRAWAQVMVGQTGECEIEDGLLNRYLNVQIRPISLSDRNISGMEMSYAVVVVQDITTRKQTEAALQANLLQLQSAYQQANIYGDQLLHEIHQHEKTEIELRNSSERIRSIVNSVVDAIITIDEQGVIESFNASAERIFGYMAVEAIGQNIKLLMPEPDSRQHDGYISHYLQTGQAKLIGHKREALGKRKDGSVFPMDLALGEFLAGNKRMFTGAIRDITESKRLEQQLHLAQKMEAIGRLAGGVAHDFNNILMAIMGDCELMLQDLPGDNWLQKNIQQVLENAQRGANLTKQLLAFGRKMVIKPTLLDLNAVLANMEKLMRRLIGEHIELVTIIEPNLGRIQADAGQMEQVILNLAINARDAMPKGGKLTIQTANVELTELELRQNSDLQVGSYVMVTILDTGTGIAAENLPYIFEPFFTTKGVGEGTGLGLSTVHGVVKQSGGHIMVQSQVGQGTTFKVYFPRLQHVAKDSAPTTSPLVVATGGHETILVVEDELSVQLIIQRLLAKRGYQVITASYGKEALNLCQQTQPKIDLIVTDIMLPKGMTGRELVEQLKPQYPQLRILFMSGYADDIVNQQDLQTGGVGFLQKPFALADLTKKVRYLLDQNVN